MTPKSFEEESLLSSDERNETRKAYLILEDGTTYSGISFGADCNACTSGEVSGNIRALAALGSLS